METIFDFNPTDAELKILFPMGIDKNKYLSSLTEDQANADICRLFSRRGDDEKAQIYFDKVKDKELRNKITYGSF